MFNLLRLPSEVRKLVYWQLLAIDPDIASWDWSLHRIGAFVQRCQITRVNSQIRKEAQHVLFTAMTWCMRVHYDGQYVVLIKPGLAHTLRILNERGLLCYIRRISLTFDI